MSNRNIPHRHHLLLHTPLPCALIVLCRLGAKPSLVFPYLLAFLDDGSLAVIRSLGRARNGHNLVWAADARAFFISEAEGALVHAASAFAAAGAGEAGAEGVGPAGADEGAKCGDTSADNADATFHVDPDAEVDERVCL